MWFLEKWLDNPRTVKIVYMLYISLIAVCVLGVVVQFAEPSGHGTTTQEEVSAEHTVEEVDEEATAEHVADDEDEESAPFAFEEIPVFSALFGLIMCVVLGLGAKAYGHKVVMKEEDYYDR
ncbi:MAG: hypothetical protein Q7J10_05465 [Methanosarcinaceae archaeon]|nr:hypothetical protein [Methanosarcinaceae archaeon]